MPCYTAYHIFLPPLLHSDRNNNRYFSIIPFHYYNTARCYSQHQRVLKLYNELVFSREVNALFVYSRVRDLREDRDLTQRDIAQMLNMQLTVYQRYERGERELPLWAAIRLADFYQVTLDYLVGRTQ